MRLSLLLAFLVALTLAVSASEGWPLVDAFYFMCISLSSVGLGDLTVSHSYLLGILVLLATLFLAAQLISLVSDFLVSRQKRLAQRLIASGGRRVHSSTAALYVCLSVLALGVLVCYTCLPASDTPLKSLYAALVIISTTGYGEMAPETPAQKLVVAVFGLLAPSVFVGALGSYLSSRSRAEKRARLRNVVRQMVEDPKKLLEADTDGDGRVDKYEFLRALLPQLDIASLEQIDSIMRSYPEELGRRQRKHIEIDYSQ